jgi:hypothetical protein
MDPIALDDLGYQRNQVVCATLIAPTEEEVARGSADLDQLVGIHSQVGISAMRIGGRCACEVARSVGVNHLVPRCVAKPTEPDCTIEESDREAMNVAIAPLREAVREVTLPVLHWRLAGVTDRQEWFVRKQADVVGRYPGGTTVVMPGQGLPARPEYALTQALLEVDDVVAVVRQNGDDALLVVREIGRELVLDHFSFPDVSLERRGLVALYGGERAQLFIDALAPPDEVEPPALSPQRGNLFEVRRAALERVDDMLVVLSGLSRTRYRASDAERQQPPVLVDRVTVQAPFGREGQVLRARLELSPEGEQWTQTLPSSVLSPTLEEIDPSDEVVSFTAPRGMALPFYLRGGVTEAFWIHGIHGISEVAARIERAYPSAIAGKIDDFQVDIPAGPLPEDLDVHPELAELTELLGEKPHRLSGGLTDGRTVFELRLAPR